MTSYYRTAYVQGDWKASPVSEKTVGMKPEEALVHDYNTFLGMLDTHGIQNNATWHIDAKGVETGDGKKHKSADVLRNYRQVDNSDCVISYLIRENPEYKHWGSLTVMAYAVGKGKPCYIVANKECCVWRSHFIYHPLVRCYYTVDELLKDL